MTAPYLIVAGVVGTTFAAYRWKIDPSSINALAVLLGVIFTGIVSVGTLILQFIHGAKFTSNSVAQGAKLDSIGTKVDGVLSRNIDATQAATIAAAGSQGRLDEIASPTAPATPTPKP